MTKKNVQMLMACVNVDDTELAKYAEEKLLTYGVSRLEIDMAKKKDVCRIEDGEIFKLYNSEDPFLSMKARELVVRYHERYLYFIMGKYFSGYEKEYSDDLYQCGVVGLLKSLTHYDGKYAISTYSRLYIIHEMTGFVYYLKNIPSPHYARIQNKIKSAETFLECNGIDVTDEAIAKEINISLKAVKKERWVMKVSSPVYIDAYPIDALEQIFVKEDIVESAVLSKLNWELFDTVIKELPAKQQLILYMKVFSEYSFQEIADILGIEKKKVYKKYYAALSYIKQKV